MASYTVFFLHLTLPPVFILVTLIIQVYENRNNSHVFRQAIKSNWLYHFTSLIQIYSASFDILNTPTFSHFMS